MAQPTKTRRTSEAKVASGLDAVIDSALQADIDYVSRTLVSGGPKLASFVASMLRDGQIQKALASKEESAWKAAAGKKLADRVRKMRHVPAKFAKEFVVEALGKNPAIKDDGTELAVDPRVWVEQMAYGLRVTLDVEIPQAHDSPRHEGALRMVFHARAEDVNLKERLRGLTPENIGSYGAYFVDPANPRQVVPRYMPSKIIQLTCWPEAYFNDAECRLEVERNDSIFDAVVRIYPFDGSQSLWSLFRIQFPDWETFPFQVDNEGFEFPDAAKILRDMRSGGGGASASTPAPPAPGQAAVAGEPAAIVPFAP